VNDPLVENPFLSMHNRATKMEALIKHLVRGNLEKHAGVGDVDVGDEDDVGVGDENGVGPTSLLLCTDTNNCWCLCATRQPSKWTKYQE